jgi:glycosyltransferase involved in cell wall biosynthesis
MLSFGVIICTYNRKHLLEQCLSSWSQSDYLPDQFIIVDATENAEQYREELLEEFPRLFSSTDSQYIVTDQPGLTRQRNLGLSALKTDIVCFTDDDAFVSKAYSTKILEVFQRDQKNTIGGINGVGLGQFDTPSQKYLRLLKNFARDYLGWFIQRIHIPRSQTKLFAPLASELKNSFSLIHIDRLWGANMNYRTELIRHLKFDENFKGYGLFEDVDLSVQVGKTHKLLCRLDAELTHDDELGKSTRLNDAQYFLASWLNSAYIIEKLFPCKESRASHRRLFSLVRLLSKTLLNQENKLKILGNEQLLDLAAGYISAMQNCGKQEDLGEMFIKLQEEIFFLDIYTN